VCVPFGVVDHVELLVRRQHLIQIPVSPDLLVAGNAPEDEPPNVRLLSEVLGQL
jgi:hypothetical protein